MRLLMIGAPGAGKGTQAVRIAQHFRVTHISSGDLLRKHVTEQTSIGKQISRYMEAGDLVPDSVVMDLLRKPIVSANAAGGYVLDGFPRTLEQAEAAAGIGRETRTSAQAVVYLDAPADVLIGRLSGRGENRADDSEAVARHRLEVYAQHTQPLVDYYAARGVLVKIDAAAPVDVVSQQIFAALDRIKN
jgi:adenylate kinase